MTTQTQAQTPVTKTGDATVVPILSDALVRFALTQVQFTKEDRSIFPVGTHPIDRTVSVHVKGTVTVGKDYEQRIVANANPWLLLRIAMSKLNDTTMAAIVREALSEEGIDTNAIKAQADECVQALRDVTKKPCKGKVTKKLEITIS